MKMSFPLREKGIPPWNHTIWTVAPWHVAGQKCKPWDWTDVVQNEDPKGMALDVIFRAKCWVPTGKLTIMANNGCQW